MVARPGKLQASFTSGELDPLLHARTNLKYFPSGLKHAENVALHPQGGFTVRMGLRLVAAADPAARRLIAFTASDGAAFDVVLQPLAFTAYDQAGAVQTVATPYDVAHLPVVNSAQLLDTALLFHVDIEPKRIRRAVDTGVWSFDAAPLTAIPTHDYGAVYTNGVAAVWELEFIGLSGTGGSESAYTITVSGQETRALKYDVLVATLASEIQTAILELPNIAPGVTVMSPGANKVRITFGGTGNTGDDWAVAGRVQNKADAAIVAYKTTPGVEPGEPLISADRGWPRCGAFYSQRLLMGGFRSLPNAWIASLAGDYYKFDDRLDEADGPFLVPMDTPGGEAVERIVAGRNLLIFTTDAEYWIAERALSKTTPPNHVQSSRHGTAAGVAIAENEGAALFVHANKGVIGEFRYTDVEGNFVSTSVSLLAAHLVEDVRDMALKRATVSNDGNTLAVVKDDGGMLHATLLREQEVTAFSRVTTAGAFQAVACNGRNELTTIVTRFGPTPGRFIERFETGLLLDQAIDRSYGAPTAVIDGLEALEDAEVWVIANDDVFGPFTVAAGAITLPVTTMAATVGRWSPPLVETLPPARDIGPDLVLQRRARIHSVILDLEDTTSIAIGANGGRIREVDLSRYGMDADVGELTQGFTGMVAVRGLTGWVDQPTVVVTQTRPGRMTVRGITIEAVL